MSSQVRPPGPLLRLTRLAVSRSDLRRSSDRAEGTVLLLLLAVFIGSLVGAGLLGTRIYQAERANAAPCARCRRC